MAASLDRYATGRFQPATFLERGICLPFTTPVLLGARVRPADRLAAELILAHPAGGDGVYVLPWAALPDICAPTLHDRALWSKVSQLPVLTPAAIRDVAREVAARGLAGRAAARAASAAARELQQARTLVHYQLLLALVRQGESGGVPPERDTPGNVQARAHAVLKRLRSTGTLPPSVAVEALEELAEVFQGCGLPGDPTRARLPRLLAEIAAMAAEVGAFGATLEGDARVAAGLVVDGAEMVLRFGRATVADAQALTDELWPLLHRWRAGPEQVAGIAARPEWVLDGWETIGNLWRVAERDAREATILEMALLVPVVPVEARSWIGADGGVGPDADDGRRRWRRTVKPQEDWMTGRLLGLTARNEQLRATSG